MSTIKLSGSFENILQIFIFIYTGIVSVGSADEEELIEDILNAAQCECMLDVTNIIEETFELLNVNVCLMLYKQKCVPCIRVCLGQSAYETSMWH